MARFLKGKAGWDYGLEVKSTSRQLARSFPATPSQPPLPTIETSGGEERWHTCHRHGERGLLLIAPFM